MGRRVCIAVVGPHRPRCLVLAVWVGPEGLRIVALMAEALRRVDALISPSDRPSRTTPTGEIRVFSVSMAVRLMNPGDNDESETVDLARRPIRGQEFARLSTRRHNANMACRMRVGARLGDGCLGRARDRAT